MKTSNKIIITFSVLFLSGIVTMFVFIKQHEARPNSYKTEVTKLQPFSVIVVEKGSTCRIRSITNVIITETDEKGKVTRKSSEMNELAVLYNPKKGKVSTRIFKQNGDTLFIYTGAKICVETSGKIRSIIGHQPKLLFLEGVKTDSIKLIGGKTNTSALSSNNKTLLFTLSKNALVNCDYSNIEHFKILSDSSEITLIGSSSSKLINVNLNRYSRLNSTGNFEVTEIEKDNTSTTNISNNVGYSGFFNDFDNIEP